MNKFTKMFLAVSLLVATACGEKKAPGGETAKTAAVEQKMEENKNKLIGSGHIDMSKANPALTRATSKDTLIVGSSEAAGNFLPIYYATTYDAPVVALVFEGLLKTDRNGNYMPGLAESLPEISEDGKTYTFKLKKGVKFHSGNPLTADDVVFTYETIADPAYDGRFTSYVKDLVGYEDYSTGKTEKFAGVEKVDDNTVKFHFKENMAPNIVQTAMGIMDSKFYAHKKGDMAPVKSKMQQLSGTGPYKLSKFEPRQYFELVENYDYYGKKPEIPKIIVKFVTDATDVQELIKGDIDMLTGVITPEKLEMADVTGFIDRDQYLRHGYGYIKFNTQDPVVADKRVRQALTYGLDRQAFLDLYFKGLAINVDAPISKAHWTYDPSLDAKMITYDFDPAKAGKLLDEAGWKLEKDGYRYKDGQKMIINWTSIKDLDIVNILMPILIENWKQLGVDVKLSPMDFNSLMDKVYKERTGFSMFNMATSEATFPDPSTSWHSEYDKTGGNNTSQFRNTKNDELLDKMKRELDRDKYKQLWQEWAININEEAPMINLYTNTYTDLYNRRVENFDTDSLWPWYRAVMDTKLGNK